MDLSEASKTSYPTSKRLHVLRKLFGGRLKHFRKKRGLTQQELADHVGVESDGTIRRWESGKRWPDPETIERIAQALDVQVHELFIFPDEPEL